jgi:hypothetical protein
MGSVVNIFVRCTARLMMATRIRFLVSVVVSVVVTSSLFSQASKPPQAPPESEIHRLYMQDQQDRGVGAASELPWEQIASRDRRRRERVHELLASGALKSGEDFHDAAFIYQHGHDPSDYLRAHILAIIAIAKGHEDSRWIAAATLDRYLQSMKEPQVFGTQFSNEDSKPYTQEPYDRELLSDWMRAQFCVPDLAHQKKDVEVFSAGKYPERPHIPGCSGNR